MSPLGWGPPGTEIWEDNHPDVMGTQPQEDVASDSSDTVWGEGGGLEREGTGNQGGERVGWKGFALDSPFLPRFSDYPQVTLILKPWNVLFWNGRPGFFFGFILSPFLPENLEGAGEHYL